MRILVAAEGSRGDVEPALGLALALRCAGHRVVASGPSDFAEPAARVGLPFHASGPSWRTWMGRYVESIVAGKTDAFFDAYHRDVAPQQRLALASLVPGFDLVVGAGLQLVAQGLCDELGVRYGYVFYCPQFLRALSLARGEGPAATVLDRPELDWRRVSPLIVAADPVLAPLPDGITFRCQQTGPLTLPQPGGLDERLSAFLDEGPPPVYIGFGSMPEADPARTAATLLSAVRRAGCRAVIAEGWAKLSPGDLPGGCLAIGDAPHDALFSRVAAVVHHGGAGTTHTAARAGAPQIVVPRFADQFYWGHRVRALGLGPRLLPHAQLEAGALADALSRCVGDQGMRDKARAFADAMRARDGAASSVAALTAGPGAA